MHLTGVGGSWGGGGGEGGSTGFSTYSTNPHLLLLKIAQIMSPQARVVKHIVPNVVHRLKFIKKIAYFIILIMVSCRNPL